jgi:hypothetical protein
LALSTLLLIHFYRELFIANGLSRHFAWSYNVMFVEDMLNPYPCCRKHKHLTLPTSMKGYLTGNKSSADFLSLSGYSSSASLLSNGSGSRSGFTSSANSSANLLDLDGSGKFSTTPTRRKPRSLFSRVVRSLLRSTGASSSGKLSTSTSTSSFSSGGDANEERNNRAILRKIRQKLRSISKNSKQQAMCMTGEIGDDEEAYDIPEELWNAEEEEYIRKRQEAIQLEDQQHLTDGETEEDTNYGYDFDEDEEEDRGMQQKRGLAREGVSRHGDVSSSPSALSDLSQQQQHVPHKENWEHHHAHHTTIDFSVSVLFFFFYSLLLFHRSKFMF